MIKLLRAEFTRMLKTKLFLLISLGSTVMGVVLSAYNVWMKINFLDEFFADENVFMFATFSGIVSAVFISIFVGKLYSDGTMRNRIIMGHRRAEIYLSEFIVSFVANTVFFLLYSVGGIAVAYPVFRSFSGTPRVLLMKFLATVAVIAVYCAIFVFISMISINKAATAIICLLSAFGLLFYSMIIESNLREPEFYEEEYYYNTETGEMEKYERAPNPNYVSGTKREIYEFLNAYLPAGQAFQIGGNYDKPNVDNIFFAYDTCTFVVLCLGGIFIFRKKDLK